MNQNTFTSKIAREQNISDHQVQAVADLLAAGASIPFIARYRKEATGSLDEVVATAIRDRFNQLREIEDRKTVILNSLEKHGHLTEELSARVLAAETMAILEDIYLPYRPKRRTKAVVAREKGLEPLALAILEQDGTDPIETAAAFIDPEKGVEAVEDALAGARDIIAEIVNENDEVRAGLRNLFLTKATVESRMVAGMEEKGAKFRDYFEWKEPLSTIPSHRMLAIRRGEKEDVLKLDMRPDEAEASALLENLFVKGQGADSDQARLAITECYKRLLSRSMETEARLHAKKRADAEAIKVFAENLRQLLLAPPLGAKQTRDSEPGASLSVWTPRGNCCITTRFFRTCQIKKPLKNPPK
jgi:uncharacterized protein